LHAQICGDAHVSNFGFFASPERRQVMDLNDFDETVVGPFEYDLKRLAASIVVCARESGHPAEAAGNAVYDAVKAYRGMTRALAGMRVIDAWSLGFDETLLKRIRAGHLEEVLDRVVRKAAGNNSVKVARKAARKLGKSWEFDDAPPLLARLVGQQRQQVVEGLERYVDTIPASSVPAGRHSLSCGGGGFGGNPGLHCAVARQQRRPAGAADQGGPAQRVRAILALPGLPTR
jgi:hypothetical protein